jgi:hypothetical protein
MRHYPFVIALAVFLAYTALAAIAGTVVPSRTGNPQNIDVVGGIALVGSAVATHCVQFNDTTGNFADSGSPCAPLGKGAEQVTAFQPGLMTTISTTKGGFSKFVKASTVENLVGSAITFTTCTVNPTITFYECGTSATCAVSPTTIGSVTVTAAGTAVDGTVSNPTITAGDYVAWAVTAGSCAALDVAAFAQVHAN